MSIQEISEAIDDIKCPKCGCHTGISACSNCEPDTPTPIEDVKITKEDVDHIKELRRCIKSLDFAVDSLEKKLGPYMEEEQKIKYHLGCNPKGESVLLKKFNDKNFTIRTRKKN